MDTRQLDDALARLFVDAGTQVGGRKACLQTKDDKHGWKHPAR